MKKKFKFFQRKEPRNNAEYRQTGLMIEVNLPVDEIPEFESEQQAFDFYKGVYLAEQLNVDNYNKREKKWWEESERENFLPKKVYIIQEFSID